MNEPNLTHHRVTMPVDMALKYLDGLLKLVNKQFLDPGYPIALSMAIDKMRAPLPDNKALTVEELREMGGQPYYHVSLQGSGDKWAIMDDIIARHIQDYYYGERWLAYRRPPEKGE